MKSFFRFSTGALSEFIIYRSLGSESAKNLFIFFAKPISCLK